MTTGTSGGFDPTARAFLRMGLTLPTTTDKDRDYRSSEPPVQLFGRASRGTGLNSLTPVSILLVDFPPEVSEGPH